LANVEKLKDSFDNLKEYTDKLRILARYPQDEFLGDFTKVNSAKYLLQISIEFCINISNQIISSEGFRKPRDYYDAFKVLNEKGIFPNDFMDTLGNMVRFRNRLVHLYNKIDDEMIYEIVQFRLVDFDLFKSYIFDFLKKEGDI